MGLKYKDDFLYEEDFEWIVFVFPEFDIPSEKAAGSHPPIS